MLIMPAAQCQKIWRAFRARTCCPFLTLSPCPSIIMCTSLIRTLCSHTRCIYSHTTHTCARSHFLVRALALSRFREIVSHLRASGSRYQYAGDSRNFRESWDVCVCRQQNFFQQFVVVFNDETEINPHRRFE